MSNQIKRYVNSIVLAISAILVCPSTGLAQDPDAVLLALLAPAAEMPQDQFDATVPAGFSNKLSFLVVAMDRKWIANPAR